MSIMVLLLVFAGWLDSRLDWSQPNDNEERL